MKAKRCCCLLKSSTAVGNPESAKLQRLVEVSDLLLPGVTGRLLQEPQALILEEHTYKLVPQNSLIHLPHTIHCTCTNRYAIPHWLVESLVRLAKDPPAGLDPQDLGALQDAFASPDAIRHLEPVATDV